MPSHPLLGIGAGLLIAAAGAQEPIQLPTGEPLTAVKLGRLLDLVKASSGKRFIVEARTIRQIYVRGDRAPTDLTYPALLSILRNNDYAAVEIEGVENMVRIVAIVEALDR